MKDWKLPTRPQSEDSEIDSQPDENIFNIHLQGIEAPPKSIKVRKIFSENQFPKLEEMDIKVAN